MICLDTNAVIGAMNSRAPKFRARLEAALAERVMVGVPVIALYELWFGIKKSARQSENRSNGPPEGWKEGSTSSYYYD